MISKEDILYLANKQYGEMKEKYDKDPSWDNSFELQVSSKRLDDALLYYEGKLKFKGE